MGLLKMGIIMNGILKIALIHDQKKDTERLQNEKFFEICKVCIQNSFNLLYLGAL